MKVFGLILSLQFILIPMLSAQDSLTKEEEIDLAIVDIREKVLSDFSIIFKDYKTVVKEIKASNLSMAKKEEVLKIAARIPDSKKEKAVYRRLEEVLFKWSYQGKLLKQLKTLERDFVDINKEFYELVRLRLIGKDHEIKPIGHQSLIKEILFYEINDGQKIAEVGAGWGDFSFVISRLYKLERLYVNELKRELIKRTKERLKGIADEERNIKIIKGSKQSAKLGDKDLDKIIIRNSFHHFSNKDEMLQSIKSALSENGKLYLSEPVTDLGKDGCNIECREAISKKAVLQSLENNGFVLERELVVGNFLLLEFEIQKDE